MKFVLFLPKNGLKKCTRMPESNEKAVRDRIAALQKEKGFTENGLAEGDTPTQKRLNRQLSHGAAITLDTLLRILETFPDVSAEWLLRGSGEMYSSYGGVTGAHKVTGRHATVIGTQSNGFSEGSVRELLAGKDKPCTELSEGFVRELLAEKDKQIQALLNLLSK